MHKHIHLYNIYPCQSIQPINIDNRRMDKKYILSIEIIKFNRILINTFIILFNIYYIF